MGRRASRTGAMFSGVVLGLVAAAALAQTPAPRDDGGDPRELGACCYSDGECRLVEPQWCATRLGDADCDGDVDFDDVNVLFHFWDICRLANADCNRDGFLNFDDIDPFIEILSNNVMITGTFMGAGTDCDPNPCPPQPLGDNCSNPKVIGETPYTDLDNTCVYSQDYDAICPFGESTAPDVVYQYVPVQDEVLDITLCLDDTAYDTKLYVYEGSCQGEYVACNDDFCTTASYPYAPYVSKIEYLTLYAGHTYYIIVDGYGSECGTYRLSVTPPPPGGRD